MPDYRRTRVAGGCYVFTVNLLDRRSDLLVREIDALRSAVRETRATRPFHIDASVVLPDPLHGIWTLPPGDSNFPDRWRTIKALFSRRVAHPQTRRPSLLRKREAGVWQRRYWEHTIRDDGDYAAHMDYVHFGQARARRASGGVALFELPALRGEGRLPGGMGGGGQQAD